MKWIKKILSKVRPKRKFLDTVLEFRAGKLMEVQK